MSIIVLVCVTVYVDIAVDIVVAVDVVVVAYVVVAVNDVVACHASAVVATPLLLQDLVVSLGEAAHVPHGRDGLGPDRGGGRRTRG